MSKPRLEPAPPSERELYDVVEAMVHPVLRQVCLPQANAVAAAFVRRAVNARPPHQHLMPLLALTHAAAGLGLLFGPEFIDLALREARRAVSDGTITLHDIFPGSNR